MAPNSSYKSQVLSSYSSNEGHLIYQTFLTNKTIFKKESFVSVVASFFKEIIP